MRARGIARRRRSHLLADKRLLLYFRAVLVVVLVIVPTRNTNALRCYAGDPAYQRECTAISYCLFIVSRMGNTQWSCDGNTYNQISLCSNLGLHDTGSGIIGGGGSVIFESSIRHDATALDDEMLAEYYKRQEDRVRSSFTINNDDDGNQEAIVAQQRRKFLPTANNIGASDGLSHAMRAVRASRSRIPPASIRYYAGQRRCFDGGDLGRICCCSTDFCNGTLTLRANTAFFLTILIALFQLHVFPHIL